MCCWKFIENFLRCVRPVSWSVSLTRVTLQRARHVLKPRMDRATILIGLTILLWLRNKSLKFKATSVRKAGHDRKRLLCQKRRRRHFRLLLTYPALQPICDPELLQKYPKLFTVLLLAVIVLPIKEIKRNIFAGTFPSYILYWKTLAVPPFTWGLM